MFKDAERPTSSGAQTTEYWESLGYESNTIGVICPRYYQSDSKWASYSYNYKSGGTIRSGGCGICALAMAVSGLTGNEITPPDIVDLGVNTVNYGAVAAQTVASTYGLTYSRVSRSDQDSINAALDSGKVCIMSIKYNGIYTGTGHFIMCVGRDGDNYYVLESAHYYTTDQAYSFSQVFSEGNQGVFVLGN